MGTAINTAYAFTSFPSFLFKEEGKVKADSWKEEGEDHLLLKEHRPSKAEGMLFFNRQP
jgi:hypothetical protein